MTEALGKIYYKNQASWEKEYQRRLNSPGSRCFDFYIREFNHTETNRLFYYCTEDCFLLMDNIASALIGMNNAINAVPHYAMNQFVQSSLIDEIQASNDIEGVNSTRREIKFAYDIAQNHSKYIRLWSVVNKYKKIVSNEEILLETPADIRALYDSFIAGEIIKASPENALDGKLFRSGSVDIVSSGQKIIHRGAESEEQIIFLLQQALTVLHNNAVPMLVRIAVFHYMFGYIHPFYDGNGRTNRLITSYLLAKHLGVIIGLRLSVLLQRNKKTYYELFRTTNSTINKGDLTPFVTGALELILCSIRDITGTLSKKTALHNQFASVLQSIRPTEKTDSLIFDTLLQASIFSYHGITAGEIAEATKKTLRTVQEHLITLSPLLEVDKSGKPFYYKLKLPEI